MEEMLYTFNNLLADKSIKHFVSTRHKGFSPPPIDSLNMSFYVGDEPSRVVKNRRRLAEEVGIPPHYFTFATQVHGNHVAVITEKERGRGTTDRDDAIPDSDAMVTNVPDICITVFAADCTPLLFFDPKNRAIGATHSGWRGTVGCIAEETIRTMQKEYGTKPEDLIVGIGPSIGPCCFGTDQDTAKKFTDEFGESACRVDANGRLYADLWESNRIQLLRSGVRPENIESSEICTTCNHETFFSDRYDKNTGRFCAGIMLLNESCVSCTTIHCNWCSRP